MEEGCACALECSMKNKNTLYFKERGATSSLPATPSCGLFLPAMHVCARGKCEHTLCHGGAGEREQWKSKQSSERNQTALSKKLWKSVYWVNTSTM
jgi:hypothetical protein